MIERTQLPIESLTLDPVQSREQAWSGDEIDRRLANSIETDGLFQDIMVRPLEDIEITEVDSSTGVEYAIIAGSRRYHAAMEAGHEHVPCKILRADDLNAAWTSLSENTDRRDLSEQEIAQQLSLIFELVRPLEEPSECPCCGQAVKGETGLLQHCSQTECELPLPTPEDGDTLSELGEDGRFDTEKQALHYVAGRFRGKTDQSALNLVKRHLRTANLPPLLQSLFKHPEERTVQEKTAMDNYGIDSDARLGTGDGVSGSARAVVSLHNTFSSVLDSQEVDPTDAVLEAVGTIQFDEMSEQETRRSLHEFRRELTANLEEAPSESHEEIFSETLEKQAQQLREMYQDVETTRPFKNVDVMGPETQQHSRWHAQAMAVRNSKSHAELVRELYQERLEQLADEQGWE